MRFISRFCSRFFGESEIWFTIWISLEKEIGCIVHHVLNFWWNTQARGGSVFAQNHLRATSRSSWWFGLTAMMVSNRTTTTPQEWFLTRLRMTTLVFNKPLVGRFSVNWTISVNWLNLRAKRRYKMHLPGRYVDFRSSFPALGLAN